MRRISALLATALICATSAAPAEARHAPPKVKAGITSCKDDRITLGARYLGGSRVRGATLRARYKLIPLFGKQKSIVAKLGRRSTTTKSRAFRDLPAGIYWGQVSWAWRKGRKIVARGVSRTSTQRIGRRKGKGLCVLAVGVPPVDTTKPQVFLEPTDSAWRGGPVDATFHAFDDFSGVRQVVYRINGGDLRTGRTFRLDAEGTYEIEYAVEDAAGNVSGVKRDTLRVDTGAPTAPNVTWPPSITAASNPTIVWTASSDSGSGVQGYAVVIRNSGGAIVGFETVGGSATQATISSSLPNGAYTAQVSAVDGTTPEARVTSSPAHAFAVDTSSPRVTAHDPVSNEIIPEATANRNITLALDRPIRPESVVAGSTVRITRRSPGPQPDYVASCSNSPCTSIVVDPNAELAEGIYEVSWTGGILAEDGTPVAVGAFDFSVPFYETDFDDGECGAWTVPPPWACAAGGHFPGNQLRATRADHSAPGETVAEKTLSLSLSGGDTVVARVARSYTKPASGCSDQGTIELRDSGGAKASEQLTAMTAPGDAVIEGTVGASGVNLRLRYVVGLVSGSCGVSDPGPTFNVDRIRLARKP